MTDANNHATTPPILPYTITRPPMQLWPRRLVVVCLLILACLKLVPFLKDRIAIWSQYRAQAACETQSSVGGEVLFRSDGSSTGIANALIQSMAAGYPFQWTTPVTRRPASYREFCEWVDRPLSGEPHRAKGSAASNSLDRLQKRASFIDCQRRMLPTGESVLTWMVAVPNGDNGLEIRTCAVEPGTRLSRASDGKFPALDVGQLVIEFDPKVSPIALRRLSSNNPSEVRLQVEYAGATAEISAFWNGDHYRIKAASSPIIDPRNSGDRWCRLKTP